MPESLCKLHTLTFIKKETMAQDFSCGFSKAFKNTFFTEHLWISAFILQQLLVLNFAIIYSWQLSSSGKSLVREKNSPIHLKDFSDLEFFYTAIFFFFFFIFFDKCVFTLSVTQNVC